METAKTAQYEAIVNELNRLCNTTDVFLLFGDGDNMSLLAGINTKPGEVDTVAKALTQKLPFYINRRHPDGTRVDLRHVRHYGD